MPLPQGFFCSTSATAKARPAARMANKLPSLTPGRGFLFGISRSVRCHLPGFSRLALPRPRLRPPHRALPGPDAVLGDGASDRAGEAVSSEPEASVALISCPECKREVSDRAVSCPQCGCPLSDTSKRVFTTEDSFLMRNRGRGDLVHYGPLILIIVIAPIFAAPGCGAS